ncbi:hypothetical protein [Pseudomonas alkylphenolica]|uniref:Uncharacterized protein n=1 Tax=Pseudomonas alkylphenolica TaxID=237609 RepID=A0A077FCK1_9PSED|nr:hypothetical protein [Pseudomonas alkylphenolica]AIL63107.1 hypothetical protein PSAKL28_39600 [Pseudomonas alkylphenolica]
MSQDIFEIINGNPISADLFLDSNFVLYVKEHDARSDERKARPIDLKRYWLPANDVYETPSRLVEYSHYLVALIYSLDYFAASNAPSNSKCNRICFILSTIIKFFEYCWLNNIFDLGKISGPFTLKLARILAGSGWHEALNIDFRLTEFLDTAVDPSQQIFTSTNSKVSLSTTGFQSAISTNLSGNEVAVYFNRVRKFQVTKGWLTVFRANDKTPSGMKYSLLRQTLESINFLYHSTDAYRTKIVPFENYVKLAKKLTENPGTTADINSYDAGMLLEYSLEYINTKSNRTLRLLAFAAKQLTTPGDVRKNFSRVMRFARRVGLVNSDSIGSANIKSVISFLNSAIKDILNACFIVIAILNARRKRELTHKKYGLSLGSGVVVNDRAGIFLQQFYVEKTVKDYVGFFIASATKVAITTLEKLQLIFVGKPFEKHNYSMLVDRDLTLFRYKQFNSNGLISKYSQFDFECGDPMMSGNFIHSAIGKPMRLTPHMFRRLYCKIFINRYEYFMLPFLSYQLQHEDIATTQIYVSNPQAQAESAEVSKLYDWDLSVQSEAHVIHNDEIMMSMADATREKFSEIIYRSISCENTSGGYTKLTRALYKKMFSSVEYAKLDLDNIEKLVERLKNRGHAPQPFKHAQCLAGANRVKSKSKCWQQIDNKLHKENASPKLCRGCLFSWTSEEHVYGMELDLASMRLEAVKMPETSIARINMEYEIEGLESTLLYHKLYLGKFT